MVNGGMRTLGRRPPGFFLLAIVISALEVLIATAQYPSSPGAMPVSGQCDYDMMQRAIDIDGMDSRKYLAGVGVETGDNSLTLQHNSGVSLISTCMEDWGPWDLTQLKLINKTLSFTVDLSQVGCACNLAFYLVSAPARDEEGRYVAGNNTLAPGNYYCDANQVGGQWCPEIDIMEANNHAFQATAHKCDSATKGHYEKCDRAGCAQNTKDMAWAYGVEDGNTIITTKPFDVSTEFVGGPTPGSLIGMVTTLTQGEAEVKLDHGNCDASYLAQLSGAMMDGMSLRITYWGNGSKLMGWLDQPICTDEQCHAGNAGKGTISNLVITEKAQYDCFAGVDTWHSDWPEAQKTWCCHRHSLGCPAYQTVVGSVTPGVNGQIRWSTHEGKCLAPGDLSNNEQHLVLWDCNVDGSQFFGMNQEGGIVLSVKALCIEADGAENGSPIYLRPCDGTIIGQQFNWPGSDYKMRYRENPNMCIDVTSHSSDNGNLIQLWECISDDNDQIFTWSAPTTPTPVPTLAFATPRPKTSYNCYDNQNAKWPYRKKLWCCRNTHTGCPVRIAVLWSFSPEGNSQNSMHTLSSPSVDAPMTDEEVLPGDVFRISEGREGADGILFLKLEDGRGWLYDSAPGSGTVCLEYDRPTTSPSPYDCTVWYPGIEVVWSGEQRLWCCDNHNRGCMEETTTMAPAFQETTRLVYQQPAVPTYGQPATAAVPALAAPSYPPSQPAVAIPTYGEPVASSPHECTVTTDYEELSWTVEKQIWCCQNVGVGCATTTTLIDCTDNGMVSSWDEQKKAWCCTVAAIGCPDSASASESASYLNNMNHEQQYYSAFEQHSRRVQRPTSRGQMFSTQVLGGFFAIGCLSVAALLALRWRTQTSAFSMLLFGRPRSQDSHTLLPDAEQLDVHA